MNDLDELRRQLSAERIESSRRISELTARVASLSAQVVARDGILAAVAHDLLGPLSVIDLNVSLAMTASSDPALNMRLRRMRDAIAHMNRLVNDLVDAASIRLGRFSLHTEELDAAEVVADACQAIRSLCDGKSLVLHQDVRCPHDTRVLCDKTRFMQVVTNLVTNAIRFTEPGGSITIGVYNGKPLLTFFVKDTGVGIPEEDLPHIFERWWSTKGDGGLGLSIVKSIVEAHGGEVKVESKQGGGSTFFFTLPKVKEGE